MLVLTRKLGESITVGNDVRVTVLEIHGHQVRLGVEAPREIAVHREEVYRRILEENRRAAGVTLSDLAEMVGYWRRSSQTEGT